MATDELAAAGVPDAAVDARHLVAHALGVERAALLSAPERPLDANARHRLAGMIARRAAREPVSRIIGERAFYGLALGLTTDTLDPRPDTETVVSVALALWSATAGTKALMTALNIAYGEEERRGYLRYYGTAILLTLGAIAFALLALALVAVLPALLAWLPVPQGVRTALGLVRWVILAGAFVFGLAVVYRFAPDRKQPQWRWVTWGAAAATVLWLLGSALFSLYVANFGDYNKTYGALAAIVILLTWIYLTTFVVLLGAELNAETEHQTRVDSTVGASRPMGRRGARVADTLGETR